MRRILDAFSKRDKSNRIESSQSSPATFRVPLRGTTASQLSEHAPSGHSSCSSDQSTTPLPSPIPHDPPPPSKSRGLGTWLGSRRGRKQTSLLVSTLDPSVESQKSNRTERSRAYSDSRTKEVLRNNSSDNLVPERKPSTAKSPLLRSLSAHVSSRSITHDVPPVPSLSSGTIPASPTLTDIQRLTLKDFFAFTESALVDSPDPPPLVPPHAQDIVTFPTSITSHSRHIRSSTLYCEVHRRNLLKRRETQNYSGYPKSELHSISSRRWEKRQSRPSQSEAFPPRDPRTLNRVALQSWMGRPCFEDRFCNYVSSDGITVQVAPVSNGAFAVAALEFSEHLENMAGFEDQPLPPKTTVQAAHDPFKEPPLPQRVDSVDSADTDSVPPTPSQPKRGVRFHAEVEEVEPDDLIPLGVTLQIKRQKEERRRTLLLQEEKRIQKAQLEAIRAEKTAEEKEARRKVYSAELIATRERREAQRLGYQPAKRASMISSSSSLSISSVEGVAVKRPVYDPRRSSSSLQVDDKLLRPVLRSRPASFASSGEESPNHFTDRASSAGSASALGHSSRSMTSSTDSLPQIRQHSRERSAGSNHTSRSRKSSASARPTSQQQEPVPPVPFLARPWNVPDLPLPPVNFMQQGPFLASIRTQGAYMPAPVPNFYLTTGPVMMMMPQPASAPPSPGHKRPAQPQHYASFPRSASSGGGSSTPKAAERRTSSYGPSRTQSYNSSRP